MAASGDCEKLVLDPDRLAPTDSVTSTVDVFVGVCREELLKIREHPLIIILKAAKNRLIVLDAQLPVPAPAAGYEGRQWARIKVALRDAEDIRRFTNFLNAIHMKMKQRKNDRHVVVVEPVPDGRMYFIRGHKTGAVELDDGNKEQVHVRDLDIVPAVRGERAGARTWRVLTICADARSNIESDIIDHIAAEQEHFELTGLTYGLLHGKAVMVLLVHEPQVSRKSGVHAGQLPPEQDHVTRTQKRLRPKPVLANVQLVLNKQLSRHELGPETDDPMLRAHFHSRDRPGAFLAVIDSISAELRVQFDLEQQDWGISYARLEVLTGEVATGQLTIRARRARLPAGKLESWSPATMEEIGGARMNSAAGGAAGSADGLGPAENPVISLDRMMKPRSS